VKFISEFEGYFAKPYNDPVGYATVGFGHLIGYRPVQPGDHQSTWIERQQRPGVLTEPEARRLLKKDLAKNYEPAVRELFEGDGPLVGAPQHVFDALVSFAYNLGAASVTGIPGFETIGRAIDEGNIKKIGDAMLLYNKAGGSTLPGLVRRRRAERRMVRRGIYSTEI
jgi:GH24 family phage-related lysozyme (muramidase)